MRQLKKKKKLSVKTTVIIVYPCPVSQYRECFLASQLLQRQAKNIRRLVFEINTFNCSEAALLKFTNLCTVCAQKGCRYFFNFDDILIHPQKILRKMIADFGKVLGRVR